MLRSTYKVTRWVAPGQEEDIDSVLQTLKDQEESAFNVFESFDTIPDTTRFVSCTESIFDALHGTIWNLQLLRGHVQTKQYGRVREFLHRLRHRAETVKNGGLHGPEVGSFSSHATFAPQSEVPNSVTLRSSDVSKSQGASSDQHSGTTPGSNLSSLRGGPGGSKITGSSSQSFSY